MTNGRGEEHIAPKDVPEDQARRVLSFLNKVKTAQEIADAVEFSGERDIGTKVAQRILDERKKLGLFANLGQLDAVDQVGPERFTEIVRALSNWVFPELRRVRRIVVPHKPICDEKPQRPPINVRPPGKKLDFSGFIIVRLADPPVVEADDLRDVAEKYNLPGILRLLTEHKEVTARQQVRSQSAPAILDLESRAMKTNYPPLHSLVAYWRFDCRKVQDVEGLLAALQELPEVDLAYRELSVSEPVVNDADDTYAANQDYLDAAPDGIGARWAWQQPNSEGAGIGFIDLEQGWFLTHEDLPGPTLIFGDNKDGVGTYKGNHGTAVVGEAAGVDNTLGIVGIAPSAASVRTVSHYDATTDTNLHVADAILAAIPVMDPGDVLLLEVQRSYLPTETDAVDFDAIRLATAHGIIVVEAAGNGDNDLDAWTNAAGDTILDRGSAQFLDSGAIMVGASESNLDATGLAHNRIWFSNYGSRIDCYAWGEDIATAGYGDLDAGTGDDSTYTDDFGGTSGASPMVVGASLIIQGMHEATTGTRLSPGQMRWLLSNFGTPQGTGVAGNIGIMPDLQDIIQNGLGLVPDIYVRDNVGDTGVIPTVGSISASPDVIISPTQVPDPTASFGESSGTENSNTLGYEVEAGQDNFIYVRMSNRGVSPANGVRATVYWSEVSTLLTPDLWNLIGTSNPVNVPVGDTLVVTDPIVWASASIPATGHYCIVALIDHGQDPAPPIPPATDWDGFKAFIRNYNNVTWRNFNVVDVDPDPSADPAVLPFQVAGAPDRARRFDMEIQQRLPEDVQVWLEVPPELFGLLPVNRFAKVEVDKKRKRARLLLPRLRSLHLCGIRLSRAARLKSRFLIRGGKGLERGWHSIAIRQLSEGEEVGRITWAIRPPKLKSKKE